MHIGNRKIVVKLLSNYWQTVLFAWGKLTPQIFRMFMCGEEERSYVNYLLISFIVVFCILSFEFSTFLWCLFIHFVQYTGVKFFFICIGVLYIIMKWWQYIMFYKLLYIMYQR